MSARLTVPELRMIPLERIEVLNPRERNQRKFEVIVNNIGAIGLKKPVTVTPRAGEDGAERYLLVCGEGRLKAFQRLGESRIPALVVTVTDEDAFVMSLTENIARRRHQPMELLHGITLLRDKGCSLKEISQRIDLNENYVRQILELADKGEELGFGAKTRSVKNVKAKAATSLSSPAKGYPDGLGRIWSGRGPRPAG